MLIWGAASTEEVCVLCWAGVPLIGRNMGSISNRDTRTRTCKKKSLVISGWSNLFTHNFDLYGF